MAEFVNDAEDYVSKPPYIEIPSVRRLPCTAHTLGQILIMLPLLGSSLFSSFSIAQETLVTSTQERIRGVIFCDDVLHKLTLIVTAGDKRCNTALRSKHNLVVSG